MEQICDKKQCSGCQACKNICPKQCITMKYDEYGVAYPSIDQSSCVDCKACEKVCPVNQPVEKRKAVRAYAAWHNDLTTRRRSASGGAAMAMYETMIEQGGVCFGTKFDPDLSLRIQSAETLEEVHAFRASKYVQASVENSFRQTKDYLQDGRSVLYIGTPCQIAGLKNYLKKDYENLITVDLICHGVPSWQHLMDHVKYLNKDIQKQIDDITFRGAYSFQLSLYEGNNVVYQKDRFLDPYFTGFLEGLFYRENCYSCPYACDERVSDITIGDFWGLGQEEPCAYNMGDGVSVLLPTTEKGFRFVETLKKKMFVDERPVSEAVHGNAQLMHPSERHPKYEEFRKLYVEQGFENAAWECTKEQIKTYRKQSKPTLWKVGKRKAKSLLRKIKQLLFSKEKEK